MKLRTMIWKELWQRPTPMLTSLMAVTFGVAALVAIQNITDSSEKKIASDMEALGANVLVLPPSVTLQDYYGADMHGKTMPEEYVSRLALARMPGVENLAPKLCVETSVDTIPVTLTGILPQSEFQAKAAWQGLGMITNPIGTDRGCCATTANINPDNDPNSLATNRTVQDLGDREVIVGRELAEQLQLQSGDKLDLYGEEFSVLTVLPSTGTIDDGRLFAHLHSVQDLSESGPVINVIEIIACCEDAAGSLITNLSAELPETKIITIAQVVDTQVSVNRLMGSLSWVFFSILLLVGAASIASVMYANVIERRKEIGTMMALGASRSFVTQMFLGKALILGCAGGVFGFVVGTVLAFVLGPQLLGISVQPIPQLLLVGLAAATTVSVAASIFPARKAAGLDPCLVFSE
ncbi:Macrolide export ATP-binding/permease protein MacB [Thalassoglobus neptunius]|uniref:Macrolide export ATP-binding/permease protein MacB n=1 Tax=Thalassoglobus neptunius TaxID=1938619 RepID=A0A5C5WLZ8_9PLAN|nr:FtsX-like permease family protein [Thalassoglobus neptunius]TWT51688.1 Macrolide export ATP-binding/permease protein MacB [Thalassoglobus neptunius]